MKLLFLKSLRTIRFNKIRYLGALILIILSSALFTAFRTSGYSIQKSLDDFWVNNSLADVSFEVVNAQKTNGLDESDKYILEQYFDTVEQRYYMDIKTDGVTLRVFQKTDTLNTYQLLEGIVPKNQNEVLIDRSFADYHNISIGDTLSINNKHAKVTGFFTLPDYITVSYSESNVINQSDVFGLVLTSDISNWTPTYKTEYLAKLQSGLNIEQKEKIFKDFNNALMSKGWNVSLMGVPQEPKAIFQALFR